MHCNPELDAARFSLVDRLYFGWFATLTGAVVLFGRDLPGWPEYVALHVVMVGGILLLAWTAPVNRAANFLHDWYPLALFVICFEEVARLSFLFTEGWRDGYLLTAEARMFPLPPTAWLNQHAAVWLTELLNVGYFAYFVLLMIVGGAFYGEHQRARGKGKQESAFAQVMTASVLAYLLCYVVFLLFPTQGPAHTLPTVTAAGLRGGPFRWLVVLIQRYAGVHGNAFPSSHVAAGMVALIFAWRYRPRLGWILAPFVLLLCAGAVYDGYHYFSDVLAGAVVGTVASIAVLARCREKALTTEEREVQNLGCEI